MSKKSIYVCNECGYVFPQELTDLIESKTQVYCERCGTPFTLKGVKFKPYQPKKAGKSSKAQEAVKRKAQTSSNGIISGFETVFQKLINFLNYIAFIPLLVIAIVSFVNFFIGVSQIHIYLNELFIGISLSVITYYDLNYIKPKLQNNKFDEVFLDAFCFGILGSVIYGAGTILLIQGILVIIYVLVSSANNDVRLYDVGLKAKNSLNEFSAKGGFIIVLISLAFIMQGDLLAYNLTFRNFFIVNTISFMDSQISLFGFLAIVGFILILLLLDYNLKDSVEKAIIFSGSDFIKVFLIGIITLSFYGAGIFILLKGILILFLIIGKPSELKTGREKIQKPFEKAKRVPYEPVDHTEHLERGVSQKDIHPYRVSDFNRQEEAKKKEEVKREIQKLEKEEIPIIREEKPKEKEITKKEKKEEIEERIHQSLLPVKDKKDKKLVREYFSKIFKVLSKDLRDQIKSLKIPKKDKKELLEELAFLTREEQSKYIEAIVNLYKEKLPAKLIKRIRNIPNIKPEHYQNIVNQLKYMAPEEQIEFVQFLEKHTPNYK